MNERYNVVFINKYTHKYNTQVPTTSTIAWCVKGDQFFLYFFVAVFFNIIIIRLNKLMNQQVHSIQLVGTRDCT